MKELVHAEPKQIGEVGVEARDATAHAWGEQMVEPAALAQHPPDQFLRPAPIARIELRGAAVKRGVEEESGAEVRQGVGGGNASVGHEREGTGHTLER